MLNSLVAVLGACLLVRFVVLYFQLEKISDVLEIKLKKGRLTKWKN
jgi:hypothetical protein